MTERDKGTKPNFNDDHEVVEWSDAVFDRAEMAVGGTVLRSASGTLTRRGRPPAGEQAKQQVTLRLSKQVIEHFKEEGPGWQTRLGEALERYVAEAASKGDSDSVS